MKRLIVILGLILCAGLVIADQAERKAGELVPPDDGSDWRKLTSSEKLHWAIGYSQGYQDALFKMDVASGPGTECARLAIRTEKATATAGKVSGFELVSGLEKFYSDPANTYVPLGHAIRIYLLQASGKDQATIQELIETARALGAEKARPNGAGGR
jgi:hypothetical protein